MSPSSETNLMQQCIQNCKDCHEICLETSEYCLNKGGEYAGRDHMRLLADCAQICQTHADFMSRGSLFHEVLGAVCAEVCAECAAGCESLGDDAQIQKCAEACRRCQESCEAMSQG